MFQRSLDKVNEKIQNWLEMKMEMHIRNYVRRSTAPDSSHVSCTWGLLNLQCSERGRLLDNGEPNSHTHTTIKPQPCQ